MKSRNSFSLKQAIFSNLLIIVSLESFAGSYNVYGPESFIRTAGEPVTVTSEFTALSANNACTLTIMNGGLQDGEFEPVSSSIISLNGMQVVGPSEFNQKVTVIEKSVEISTGNELSVEVRGKTGGALTLQIICIDDDAPTITATVDPQPNDNGWNNTDVAVNFICSDMLSGISICPDPVPVTSEGENQVVTGIATDNANNSATVSVSVNIDMTPPSITRSWPPDDNFGTDRNRVEVGGLIADSLSGPGEAVVRDGSGEAALPVPVFSMLRSLQTDIPSGELWRTNQFEIQAVDQAGNSTTETFAVRYTLGATVSLTDPSRTELVAGVVTSVNRAIVRFGKTISRDRIHEVIGDEGGRVAGYLPAGNIALAEFETEYVADLEYILESL